MRSRLTAVVQSRRRRAAIVSTNLILHLDAGNAASYPGSGTAWYDLTANDLDATLVNGPTYASGYIRCDGVNDYIEIADNALFDFGTGGFTVEYWFRKLQDSAAYDNIWGPNQWTSGGSPGSNQWNLGIGGEYTNQCAFGIEVTGGSARYSTGLTASGISLNTWYQLVGVRSGDRLKLYLNGAINLNVVPSGMTASTAMNNAAGGKPLRIANSGLNNFYTNVDSAILRIYSRDLSDTEVLQNWNATKGRFGL